MTKKAETKNGGAPPIISGKRDAPLRVLLIGTEGVGKSTFAAHSPGVLFIDAEEGSGHLDVPRWSWDGSTKPPSFDALMEGLREIYVHANGFKTLAIDTVDALEGIIWQAVIDSDPKWTSIESPGYGKGYVLALERWRQLIGALDVLRNDRGMEVVLIAHAHIKTFINPAGEDYMRFEPKLHKAASALLKEWSDCVLFAQFEELADKNRKAVSTGRRIIHTTRRAAWDAKNRLGLPEVLDLDWAAFAAARSGDGLSPTQIPETAPATSDHEEDAA